LQNTIFNLQEQDPAAARRNRWISTALIFALTTASTAVMMLCPCDTVGIHDYYAISLVLLAAVLAVAAACLIYRRISLDSGITAFLRAFIALAIAGVCVFVELVAAMEATARMAGPR
jgi:hypothetical protein